MTFSKQQKTQSLQDLCNARTLPCHLMVKALWHAVELVEWLHGNMLENKNPLSMYTRFCNHTGASGMFWGQLMYCHCNRLSASTLIVPPPPSRDVSFSSGRLHPPSGAWLDTIWPMNNFYCDFGYTLSETAIQFCHTDGIWSDDLPICTEIFSLPLSLSPPLPLSPPSPSLTPLSLSHPPLPPLSHLPLSHLSSSPSPTQVHLTSLIFKIWTINTHHSHITLNDLA